MKGHVTRTLSIFSTKQASDRPLLNDTRTHEVPRVWIILFSNSQDLFTLHRLSRLLCVECFNIDFWKLYFQEAEVNYNLWALSSHTYSRAGKYKAHCSLLWCLDSTGQAHSNVLSQ